ncbi:MAG: type I restriction endonuclease subunit R [Candidatus Omnitrophota bacterium]
MKVPSEKTFEAYIQETMSTNGWIPGSNTLWDKQNALFPHYITAFVKDTQPTEWSRMEKDLGTELPDKFIDTLIKERNLKGTLHILRHGFKFYGKMFYLAFFKPAHNKVEETLQQCTQNTLHVTRQVPCHPKNNSTVDMVLSINGLPIATIELKNPASSLETWKDAINQYRTDRDPRTPLFQFTKGAIVHFAIDPNEIYMTTQLNNDQTFFLPFNRGSNPGETECGQGNPQHPSGHRTAYFWEHTLQRDHFLDIVQNFIFLEETFEITMDNSGKRHKVSQKTVIFPRFHQLDAVSKLIATIRNEKSGHNYLIQHSAGSGKTNSISWLAHRLSSLHTNDNKIFDCVIVISDRRVLDKQLQDAVYQIEHAKGVVKVIDKKSDQLANALIDGTKIIVTTLQKFPFILRNLLHIAGAPNPDDPDETAIQKSEEWLNQIASRKYALIVDEAHSSQSGEAARELKRILGAGSGQDTEDTEPDWEDNLNKVMESRKQQKNLSFFAFTATPKGKTLEIFGHPDSSGTYRAFHSYSMRQAIEEGFILDVLRNYTTYEVFYKLAKTIDEDPEMSKKKAVKKLFGYLSIHPHNIEEKTRIMVEHFREHVKNKLNGRAKAMVVTTSRLHAVRYMQAFTQYINKNNYTDIRPLVAFSGTVTDPETRIEYTESSMNIDVISGKPISELQLPDRFDSSDYQILIVANKYQTGFDQPLLCAMYVDKRLDGVQAIQTLSRLNRIHAGKEPPLVVDFVNDAENIQRAFKPYYNTTTLLEPADPHHLVQLEYELRETLVFEWVEVTDFCQIFYKPQYRQNPADHAKLESCIQPAADRFNALDSEHRRDFYDKMTAFVRFYAFISQILPYSDPDHEMLYAFGRYLLTHISIGDGGIDPHPERNVYLNYYRIEKQTTTSIVMEPGEQYGVKSPTAVGTGMLKDEEKPLSEIIQVVNDRFGTDFTEEDRLFFEQIKEKACRNDQVIKTARANSLDLFERGIEKLIDRLMVQRMAENDKIVTKFMDDTEFRNTILPILAKDIYQSVLAQQE